MCAVCELRWMKNWKGRTLCLNYSRQVLFSLSLAVTVEFDPGPVDLIALQFRFIPPLNRSCVETHPLWTCEIVKRCKSSSNTQKICKWFWKLTPAWTCKPFWKVNFVAVVVVRLTEFAWKLRSNIKKFQTKICCFFVAAGLVFSVFFFLLFRR